MESAYVEATALLQGIPGTRRAAVPRKNSFCAHRRGLLTVKTDDDKRAQIVSAKAFGHEANSPEPRKKMERHWRTHRSANRLSFLDCFSLRIRLRDGSDDADHRAAAWKPLLHSRSGLLRLPCLREFACPNRDVSGRHGNSGRTQTRVACNGVR